MLRFQVPHRHSQIAVQPYNRRVLIVNQSLLLLQHQRRFVHLHFDVRQVLAYANHTHDVFSLLVHNLCLAKQQVPSLSVPRENRQLVILRVLASVQRLAQHCMHAFPPARIYELLHQSLPKLLLLCVARYHSHSLVPHRHSQISIHTNYRLVGVLN